MLTRVNQRQCVACRMRRPKEELLRVTRLPGGKVEYDPLFRKPGRGAYCCNAGRCLTLARTGDRLGATLGKTVPPSVYLEMAVVVGREDSREAEALLGFAIRSGKAVFGIPAVESLVKTGGIRLLLLAGEASQNTQAKIERLASAHGVRLTRFTGTFALKTIPGKPHCKVVGITDADFARRIDTALDENNLRGVAVGE